MLGRAVAAVGVRVAALDEVKVAGADLGRGRAFLQVEARATHDRLTGVANRETLLTTLVAEVERATRHHKWLSVAFIDIDRFKPINDTFGHNSGDAVLRQVASLIADNVRASDLFGRYGGEEFMLILPETAPDEAAVLAEKLRSLVMAEPMVIAGNQQLQITISAGIAGEVGGPQGRQPQAPFPSQAGHGEALDALLPEEYRDRY